MNFDEKDNNGCLRCNNKENRDCNVTNGLCNATKSIVDDLPVRCVGEWGKHKISFLTRYLDIVGKAMKGKRELNYIEICSGPGRCIDRATGKEFDGTPLAVLKTEGIKFFSHILFVDYDIAVIRTLANRIEKNSEISTEMKEKKSIFVGDYKNPDELVFQIKSRIGKDSLNILFIDPTDISVPWETIKKLSSLSEKTDLIINEAIFTDFNRNSIIPFNITDSKVEKKWESALGTPDFFKSEVYKELAKNNDRMGIRKLFRDRYMEQLNSLGYTYLDERDVSHFYYLIFASRNELGIKFWQQACLKDGSGQSELDFGI